MQHVHDGKAGVQPDEIGQFQRPHRVIGPELHRLVDGLHVAHAFIERVDRLVDHRHQDAVHDEGGEVLGGGRGLADPVDDGLAGGKGFLVRGDAADQFHQLHHRNRVHEVEAHELFGPVGAAGQTGDRDRRGVRGQDRGRLEMRQKVFEDGLLDGLALGRGFDHEVGGAQVGQLQRGLDAPQGGGLVLCADLAAADLAFHVLVDQGHRLVQRVLRDIGHQHVIAGQRTDMGDAIAHLTRAHDADRLNVHVPFLRPECCAHHRRVARGQTRSNATANCAKNHRNLLV